MNKSEFRPYKRKIFHILTTTPFLILGFLIDTVITRKVFLIIVVILLIVILSVEIPRLANERISQKLLSTFPSIYKEHERRNIVSSIWGPLDLLYMTILLTKPAIVSMLCVGCLSDPLAAIIGLRFGGKTNRTGRTWAGTIAHFGFTVVFITLSSYIVPFYIHPIFLIVLAMLAALSERYCSSKKYFILDDNFIVPLVVAISMEFGIRFLGIIKY